MMKRIVAAVFDCRNTVYLVGFILSVLNLVSLSGT